MTAVLLTVKQVAAICSVSARQIFKLVSSGRFPAPVRLGRSVRWRETDIEGFLARGCTMEAAGNA